MRKMVLFALCVITIAASLFAQEFKGTILGRITDASGAVVPGAQVTVTNMETNVASEVQSNAEGNYVAPFLLPGKYKVTVGSTGFRQVVRDGIIVQVNDRITVDFALEVGATSEVITVRAESPMLQTASVDLGQVADRAFMDDAMLNSTVLQLANMAPGVLATGSLGFGGTMGNGQNDIAVNGGNGTQKGNDVTIDGAPALAPRQSGLAVGVPMTDAVQEFKIVTTMFDASLGRSNGGALSITTKSGTNEYHGSAFYYTQNEALNANAWENNRVGIPHPLVDMYSIGGTVGGPVRLPKYDGRNRTFFFFGFEKDRNGNHAIGRAYVPNEAMRQGDFSKTLASRGGALVLYDPLSTVVNAAGTFQSRVAFPNAIIPSNRLNPIGVKVLSKLPTPNINLDRTQILTPNWTADMQFPQVTKNWQLRVDQAVGSKHRLFVRVARPTYLGQPNPAYFPGAYSVPPNGTSNLNTDSRKHGNVTLDDTVIFTPSLVGSFRLGYTRIWTYNFMPGDTQNPADLALPDAITAHQIAPAWPIFELSQEGAPFIGSRPRKSINDIWSFMNNFNKTHGSHALRFGLDYRLTRWNENNPGTYANGYFVFNNTLTRSNPTQSSTGNTSGSGMASLLLGLPTTASNRGIGYTSPLTLQMHYVGLFFQDDWKVMPKLTLNLGLRYELETPPTERFDRLLYSFDPTLDLGMTVPGVGPLRGGVRFVNDGGIGRRQGVVDRNNFGPRVGMAYSLASNTVFRAGYGIFYSSDVNHINAPTTDGAFGAITQYVGSTGGDTQPIPGVSLSNPFPNGYVQPTGKSLGKLTDLGSTVTFVNPNRVLPYVQQWQFSLQKQFPSQVLGEVAYVGMHSVKLFENLSLNETPDAELANVANIPNPFRGILPPASTLGQGSSIRAVQLLRAFPQLSTVTLQRNNDGRVLYHSLQTRVQKRFSNGLQLVANYTHSKSLQYLQTSAVNVRHNNRTVSPIDIPNMLNLFMTYRMPFGRGRTWGRDWSRPLDAVVGGWTVAFTTHYQSGDALTVADTNGAPIPNGNPNTKGGVKDRLGDQIDPKTKLPLNPFFNRDVWISIPDFKVSPEPARWSWLRGPSQWSQTMTLTKTVPITEQWKVELRALANSPFNHPSFDNPDLDLTSPATFGVITGASGTRTITFGAKLKF
ncbi:MAG: TonB-dependent receptor domain-containing protein [Bryobacteraceae bacterium]